MRHNHWSIRKVTAKNAMTSLLELPAGVLVAGRAYTKKPIPLLGLVLGFFIRHPCALHVHWPYKYFQQLCRTNVVFNTVHGGKPQTKNTSAHRKTIVPNLGVYNQAYLGKPQPKILTSPIYTSGLLYSCTSLSIATHCILAPPLILFGKTIFRTNNSKGLRVIFGFEQKIK